MNEFKIKKSKYAEIWNVYLKDTLIMCITKRIDVLPMVRSYAKKLKQKYSIQRENF